MMTENIKIEIDTATVCRICLQTSEEKMISIYERDTKNSSLCLYEKIELCGGIKVLRSPELPALLCSKCYAFLNLAYKFRNICKHSDSYLREFVFKANIVHENTNSNNLNCVMSSGSITSSSFNNQNSISTMSSTTTDFIETKSLMNDGFDIDDDDDGDDNTEDTEDNEQRHNDEVIHNDNNDDDIDADIFYLEDSLTPEHLDNPLQSHQHQTVDGGGHYTNIEIQPADITYVENIPNFNQDDAEFPDDNGWIDDNNSEFIVEEMPEFLDDNSESTILPEKTNLPQKQNQSATYITRRNQSSCVTRKKTLDISADGTAVIREHSSHTQNHIKHRKMDLISLKKNSPQSPVQFQQNEISSSSKKNIINKKIMHICDICGNSYSKKHALEVHVKRHRNERPHECEICGQAFHFNFQLTRHIRKHTGARPFSCQYCKRKFTDRSTITKHERIHRNERPYECKECGKSFTYSNVLKAHTLTHTGEKPYNCDICFKRFSRSHHLRSHLETIAHQNDPRSKELLKKIKRQEVMSPSFL